MARRPRIAVAARFSRNASALRYEAEVSSRRLITAVWDAGGEPLMLHPHAPGGVVSDPEVAERLSVADALLLPGGGDIAAHWSGQPAHPSLYDVDEEQDAFDLACARVALRRGMPVLAVCRGLQVVTVALGGTLVPDMAERFGDTGPGNHRHHVHLVGVAAGSRLHEIVGDTIDVSCYHHQCIDRLGRGMVAVATSEDGVIEAVDMPDAAGWFVGLQWHPEDSADVNPAQAAIFEAFVAAAAAMP